MVTLQEAIGNERDANEMGEAIERREVASDDNGRAARLLLLGEPVDRGDVVATPSAAGVQAVPESEPVSAEPVPPEPVAEPEPTLSSVEQAICAYEWECPTALRVAACESGADFTAGYNASGHAGTFQISPIHAWRFANRGLDFWTDALTLEVNLDVAYEIWTERWWYAWSCF